MDLVHDRGSMDLVHESGPWTRSKEGVHGPLVHVLSSPADNNGLAPLHVNVLKYYLYLQLEKYMYFKDLANAEHQKQ